MKISGTYKSIIHYYLINLILKKKLFLSTDGREDKHITHNWMVVRWYFLWIGLY